MRFVLALLLAVAVPAPVPAAVPASADLAGFRSLAAADLRLAAIGHRLAVANAALCPDQQPGTGMTLQSLGQFSPETRDAARALWRFEAPVTVEGVAPGSPAAAAGIAAGDALVAVDGEGVTGVDPTPRATSDARDRIDDRLAALSPVAPITLVLVRDAHRRTVTLHPLPACRTRFEVVLGREWTASADGRVVQIGVRFLDAFDDDALAGVVAHELAHNILSHRARLEAAGVSRGLLAEIGRNGRLFRFTEQQADRLSAWLLFNAGYDPRAAARFWRGEGHRLGGGLFRARTHYGADTRAAQIEAEAASIPAGAARPAIPPMLAERDRPL